MSPDAFFWLLVIVLLTLDLRRRLRKLSAMSNRLRTIATPDLSKPREEDHAANPKCR